jgi:hypothetical protein
VPKGIVPCLRAEDARGWRARRVGPDADPCALAEAEYKKHALSGFRNLDRLEFSVCGDEAPVIGALAWAMGH